MEQRVPVHERRRQARPGVALLNALLFLTMMTILLVVGINYTTASFKATRNVRSDTQAYNVARAGLVDAIGWFKRQSVQPVHTFAPLPNPSNDPNGDTNDIEKIDPGGAAGEPNLGIVQEYQIDGFDNLWARYEVGKITQLQRDSHGLLNQYSVMNPDASGTLQPVDVASATSNVYEGVTDVTANYALQGQGLVWRIRSHGYVFRKDNSAPAGTRFYQWPNQVLSQCELVTEIQRLNVDDYQTAMFAHDGTTVNFTNGPSRMYVKGGSVGASVRVNQNETSIQPTPAPAKFTYGTPQAYMHDTSSISIYNAFGVLDTATIASLADYAVTNVANLPSNMSSMAFTYIKPPASTSPPNTAVFSAANPLQGGGILFIDGNMLIPQGTAATFTGYIYVNGSFEAGAPCQITGQVIASNGIKLDSPGTEDCVIAYDTTVLDDVRTELGQYRERRASMKTVTAGGY